MVAQAVAAPLQAKPLVHGTGVAGLQNPPLHVGAGVATALLQVALPQVVVG